jgi:hypothetical protein
MVAKFSAGVGDQLGLDKLVQIGGFAELWNLLKSRDRILIDPHGEAFGIGAIAQPEARLSDHGRARDVEHNSILVLTRCLPA